MYIKEALKSNTTKIIMLLTKYCFPENTLDSIPVLSDFLLGFLYSFEYLIKILIANEHTLKRSRYDLMYYLDSLYEYLYLFMRYKKTPKDIFYIVRYTLLTSFV